MKRLFTAVKAFFQALRGEGAKPVTKLLPPPRSDAVALLSILQREARLVDFLMESISHYNDAQVGAAVRDIHRDAAAALQRVFALSPVTAEQEGASITLPPGYDPASYKLTGQLAGQPPYKGSLCHHGWKATKCELPEWTGAESGCMIVAPAEVEIR